MEVILSNFLEEEIPKNSCVLGDCLEAMKLIPQGSVDFILTDLPYGTTDAKWDEIIPFNSMWRMIGKVAKESAAIILFGTEPFSSKLRLSNEQDYRYDWYWEKEKGSNFLFENKMPMKVIETASVFYKKQPTYIPQKILNPKGVSTRWMSHHKGANSRRAKELLANMPDKPCRGKSYEPDKLLPKNRVYFAREQQNKFHPTQKPLKLLEYLIMTYTEEGQTVLDFTAGSFSTAIAAINKNRNYIVIEKEKKYFDIGFNRVRDRLSEIELDRKNSLF